MKKQLTILLLASTPAFAGFPVVYDSARGVPTQQELSVPIKFNGVERCEGSRRPHKISLKGSIELSALAVPGLTGQDAGKGLDFHESGFGVGATIQLSNSKKSYGRTFYESAGATLQATNKRVVDYFSGVVTGGTDKVYGFVLYDYPKKSPAKDVAEDLTHSLQASNSKFAIPGRIAPLAIKYDSYHHVAGEAWLSSDDGVCRIHGIYKQAVK